MPIDDSMPVISSKSKYKNSHTPGFSVSWVPAAPGADVGAEAGAATAPALVTSRKFDPVELATRRSFPLD